MSMFVLDLLVERLVPDDDDQSDAILDVSEWLVATQFNEKDAHLTVCASSVGHRLENARRLVLDLEREARIRVVDLRTELLDEDDLRRRATEGNLLSELDRALSGQLPSHPMPSPFAWTRDGRYWSESDVTRWFASFDPDHPDNLALLTRTEERALRAWITTRSA